VPDRLDGTGAAVAVLVDELRGLIDDAQAPLAERHQVELAELAEREERLGTRGSGRKDLEERHKREVRLVRDDELRSGLAAVAGVYRRRLAAGGDTRAASEAMKLLAEMGEQLVRNPNETLALQALFIRLGRLDG
jgi:DNA polymerase-3 subunit delta'